MLTMGKPIQPKSIRSAGTLNEMFEERIRANYEQLRGHINPAKILHFLSAPPEVYVAETGMTTLVNQENSTEIQTLEISLLNNVLNRILVSGHLALTYQDRVFVENILKKLGVTDVREWMRQVRMIKEETRNVRELLSLYESGRDVIRLIGEYRRQHLKQEKTGKKPEERQEETEEPGAADRLAAAVFHRLQTEKIYREAGSHAFLRIGDRTTIDRQELSFGEQSIAAAYLTLNDSRNRLFARQDFVYNRADQYEIWDINRTDGTYGQTGNSLLQTVLLNAVRQLFHIRFQEFTRHTGWRHTFMDALHVSVRNTCQRLALLPVGTFADAQDRNAWQQTWQYFEREEIDSLQNLFTDRLQTTIRTVHDAKDTQTTVQDRTTVFETHRQDENTDVIWQEHPQLREQSLRAAGQIYTQREKEIIAQLKRIDRQNVERMERLAEYTRQIGESKERRIDRERTKVDAIRAVNGTGQEKTVYREREIRHTAESVRETEKLREILGEETVRVFETIRRYQEEPRRYPQVTALDGQAVNLFLRDIAVAGKAPKADLQAGDETTVYDGTGYAEQRAKVCPLSETVVRTRDRWHGIKRADEKSEQAVELFHRQNEQTISEETLQELLQNRRKDRVVQNTDIRETFRTEEQVTEIVRSKVNEMKVRQDEEIARLIGQNVKRQLDTLSEKVYGKLERRMDAERRRRGL